MTGTPIRKIEDHFGFFNVELSDAKELYNLIDSNRPSFLRYFPKTCSSCKSEKATINYIRNKILQQKAKEFYFFKLCEGQQIRGILMIKNIDWRIPKGELAYLIDPAIGGKGIMTSAVAQLCDFCFQDLKFHKIFIMADPNNIASVRVAEKNNFQLEGTLRDEFRIETGELVNTHYFGKLSARNKH